MSCEAGYCSSSPHHLGSGVVARRTRESGGNCRKYLGSIIFLERGIYMQTGAWTKEFPVAITVCNTEGTILEMNDRSAGIFAKDGGRELVGGNVLDCHPAPARSKLKKILDEQLINCYTIEKNGVRKLIYQAPWYEGEQYMGMVELAIELPGEIPHFIR